MLNTTEFLHQQAKKKAIDSVNERVKYSDIMTTDMTAK